MSRDFFIKGAKQMKKGIRIVSVILAAVMMFIIADRIPAITDWFSANTTRDLPLTLQYITLRTEARLILTERENTNGF